jgi:type I restriction enzyme S subunit
LPWISAKSLKTFYVRDSEERLTEAGASRSTCVPPGTVLFVVRGMSLAREFRVGVTTAPVAFNQDLRALVPAAGVDGTYLARFLQASAREILGLVDEASHGTKRLTSGRFENINVPLPPLVEQRRIAAILDQADALRTKRRAALAQLDALAESIFIEMFGDPATNPKGWPNVSLGSLVQEFRYGTSVKAGASGTPVLRIPNVVDGRVSFDDLKFVELGEAELKRLALQDGDVLFVRTNGNQDFVGRCAAFAEKQTPSSPVVFASYLIRARLDQERLRSVFLREFLKTAAGRRQLHGRSRTSAGQFNISIDGLAAIALVLPPLQLQNEFRRRLEGRVSLENAQRTSLASLDALFASLQHRAFHGEL